MPISISGTTGVSLVTDASITPVKLSQPRVIMTSVNSTSGTAIDFTGIPSWATRITVLFNGVSLSATSVLVTRIGSASGIEATGYQSAATQLAEATTVSVVNDTTGFQFRTGQIAATISGSITLVKISNNNWVANGFAADAMSARCYGLAGQKALPSALDRIRITSATGTDLFDAGILNVMYE